MEKSAFRLLRTRDVRAPPSHQKLQRYRLDPITPGGSLPFTAYFEPSSVSNEALSARITTATNDPIRPQQHIDLQGRAGPSCPQPVIEISGASSGISQRSDESPAFSAEPLDRVILDAGPSVDPGGGDITHYSWTIIEKPADSGAMLSTPEESTDELFLDLAGTYVAELNVFDEHGEEACSPARMIVEARVAADVHIQLVWDTPGDSDRYNDHGSDMDLHFLHPQGTWNQAPWDCNWRNRQPTWSDSEDGNPSLDIDATQGWGPENINLDGPEAGLSYAVGVNYFTDRGYGPSIATIRVYLYGDLATELTSEAITVGQFWSALLVEPSEDQAFVILDQIHDGFPNLKD